MRRMCIFFIACFALLQIVAGVRPRCYQCNENVLKPCTVEDATVVTCSEHEVCGVDIPPGYINQDFARRACVFNTTNPACDSGYTCRICHEDLCNDDGRSYRDSAISITSQLLQFLILISIPALLVRI